MGLSAFESHSWVSIGQYVFQRLPLNLIIQQQLFFIDQILCFCYTEQFYFFPQMFSSVTNGLSSGVIKQIINSCHRHQSASFPRYNQGHCGTIQENGTVKQVSVRVEQSQKSKSIEFQSTQHMPSPKILVIDIKKMKNIGGKSQCMFTILVA